MQVEQQIQRSDGTFRLSTLTPFGFRALLVCLAICASLYRIFLGVVPIDDAFITFRYAANIVDGLGFVYNIHEHILGTSTPLYTLLLAALQFISKVDLPSLSLWVNSLADAGNVALIALIAQHITRSQLLGLLCGLLWAIAPPAVFFARSGMETASFILLILLALYHLEHEHFNLAAAFGSLATLTRPDGCLVLALVGLAVLLERREKLVPVLLISTAILAPWCIFSLWFFGSPIPHSAIVKAFNATENARSHLILTLSTIFFLGGALRQLFGTAGILIAGILLLGAALCFAVAVWEAFRTRARWGLILMYPLLYLAALLIGNIFPFPWYMVPPLPMLFLGVVIGGWFLRSTLGLFAVGVLLAVQLIGAFIPSGNFVQMEQREHERLVLYTAASQAIRPYLANNAVLVGLPEVGIIGYYLRPYSVLDMAGLVSDLAPLAKQHTSALAAYRPPLLVGMVNQLNSPQWPEASDTRRYLPVWELRGSGGGWVQIRQETER